MRKFKLSTTGHCMGKFASSDTVCHNDLRGNWKFLCLKYISFTSSGASCNGNINVSQIKNLKTHTHTHKNPLPSKSKGRTDPKVTMTFHRTQNHDTSLDFPYNFFSFSLIRSEVVVTQIQILLPIPLVIHFVGTFQLTLVSLEENCG